MMVLDENQNCQSELEISLDKPRRILWIIFEVVSRHIDLSVIAKNAYKFVGSRFFRAIQDLLFDI